MSKTDLISKMAEGAGITKAQATEAYNAFTNGVSDALKTGEKVVLVGFGTFATSLREAHTGRNPSTGAAIEIAAKTSVKFKAGKELSDNVQ